MTHSYYRHPDGPSAPERMALERAEEAVYQPVSRATIDLQATRRRLDLLRQCVITTSPQDVRERIGEYVEELDEVISQLREVTHG